MSVAQVESFHYVGGELELFEHAVRWKAYWSEYCAAHIRGHVLEVGAGLGVNTRLLAGLPYESWTCLEPDPALASRIGLPTSRHRAITGTTADISGHPQFNSILYIDVLEHIEQDRNELARAALLLAPGGSLVVLSPAHPFLFTPFDEAIGHFRRYTRSSLRSVAPAGVLEHSVRYVDAVGMLASAGNRLLLQQSMPSLKQIRLWDRWMVPLSRCLDPLLRGHLGKTVVGIWQKPA